jgi:hypothetical protein
LNQVAMTKIVTILLIREKAIAGCLEMFRRHVETHTRMDLSVILITDMSARRKDGERRDRA